MAAIFDAVPESLLEGEGVEEAVFCSGSFFFSGVGLGAAPVSFVFVCDPWLAGNGSGVLLAGGVISPP